MRVHQSPAFAIILNIFAVRYAIVDGDRQGVRGPQKGNFFRRLTGLIIRKYVEFSNKVCQTVSKQTQNICITFKKSLINVEEVGSTLYKCYTNMLCLLGWVCFANSSFEWGIF